MRNAPLAAVLLCASCTAPEPPPRAAAATESPPPIATTMVGAQPGAPITLRGRVSETPWQHMMGGVSGKSDAYFDLAGGKEQTVVYWKSPPTCTGDVVVTGAVLEVKGASKRPRGGDTKAEESYRELHVDVEQARCAD
jgi:hypothetical protein